VKKATCGYNEFTNPSGLWSLLSTNPVTQASIV
jgi:hypothetical protein